MEWSEQAVIFKKIISTWLVKEGEKYSHRAAAEYLGVTPQKYTAWIKSGQRPVAEDMRMLAREHEFSANWLLLGVGDPLEKRTNFEFNPEIVEICDTILHVISNIPDPLHKIADCGGITTTDLQNCLAAQRLPPITAIAKWVKNYRMNANYILAQIGHAFLTEKEFMDDGPGMLIRERRRDFASLDGINDDIQSYTSNLRDKLFEYKERYIKAEEIALTKEKEKMQIQKDILLAISNVCKFYKSAPQLAPILYEAIIDYHQWKSEDVAREKISLHMKSAEACHHSAAGNE